MRRQSIRESGGESPDNETHPQKNKGFRSSEFSRSLEEFKSRLFRILR